MKQLRHPHSPPRRGGRETRARAERKRDSAQPQEKGEASIEDRRKGSAELTTPALRATPPLRGGEHREVERLKAEVQRVQQQHEREQLREALRRYEELYTFAPMSLISLDRRGMILDLNERAARMLAFPIEWLRGRPFLVFVARHDVSRFLELLARLRREPATETTSADLFANERVVPVQLSIKSSLRDHEVIYRLAIVDLSETKGIEKLLKETLNNWYSLVENAPDTIMTVDRRTGITFVNRPAWGYSTRALTGTWLNQYVSKADAIKMEKCVAAAFDSGQSTTCEVTGVNGDQERWYSFSFGPVQHRGKHAPTTTVTIRDITNHKRTEESLRLSREQLREFAARLDEVREEERKRVAREIHDELGQALTILKMDLAWVQGKTQDGTRKKIKSMIAEVDQTIERVRQIVTELRPSILDELGLSAAIEWQLAQFQERTRIRGIFESSSETLNLSRDIAAALFRVVQEALTNVMRHAIATVVRIAVKSTRDVLSISIADNGKGITRQQIDDPKSFGLVGMTERVHRVGGQFNIYSSPGRGTRIEISAPLK